MSNHLGNVLVTVSDKKLQHDDNSDGTVDWYSADVITAQDYYPFGMMEPGRQYTNGGNYRYGFNGKENDNDIETGVQDYGMRIYDSRVGRFLSVDPLIHDYPFYTPYQFAGNKPIVSIDLDGAEDWMANQKFQLQQRVTQIGLTGADNIANQPAIRTNNPSNATWTQKWRDSKNILAQGTYSMVNGLYTFPQQLTSGIRNEEYVYNIGGDAYNAHDRKDEKERASNFVDFAATIVPSGEVESQLTKWANIVDREVLNKFASSASVVDKLGRYLLNPEHAVGGPKAKWFEQALGFTRKNMGDLANQIVFDASKAVETGVTDFGTKYNQTISIKGANGKIIDVVFAWLKSNKDDIVRLVTAIPAKK